MAAVREDVLKALDQVIDPVSGRTVVHQDMIQGLVVKDGHVGFALEVPAGRGSQSEPLRKICEAMVLGVKGVKSVTAVLTAHEDHPQEHREPPRPRHAPPAPQGIAGVTSIIAVASGKGGVGKSTVAVNLALSLGKLGMKVGLLDTDIYGPSVPRLLGIRKRPDADGKRINPIEKFGLKTMSIGFLVGEDEAVVWRGPMVQSALTQMMADVNWAPLDVLVLDMPPGTGDAQLTITQRVPLKGAVIVSTPQDIALIDARKGIAMFRKTQVPILGIVENMSVFVCPDCGHSHPIFGHGGARATAEQMGVPFLVEIPLVPRIREMSDAGTPVSIVDSDGPEAEAFLQLAQKVAASLENSLRPAPQIVLE
ncbi:MAG TPA: iron-sulfur cluster carrier protein ApbC [Rhizomicrobium sp.]|jgi:ATP-binding protein involved in chromosome partitioning|nr:iron-sulfur cluster carrier protein ApbC [Rhizomicrobium sp.]